MRYWGFISGTLIRAYRKVSDYILRAELLPPFGKPGGFHQGFGHRENFSVESLHPSEKFKESEDKKEPRVRREVPQYFL